MKGSFCYDKGGQATAYFYYRMAALFPHHLF
jgi:hypothetical protein